MRTIGMYMRIALACAALAVGTVDAVALSAHEATATLHTARLWVSPHGVVQHTTLSHCVDDGIQGQPEVPCTWNVGPGVDGNGRGVAYWMGRDGRIHFVWNLDPTVGTNWRWVSRSLADALAEGDRPMADTRPWERCATKTVPFGAGRHRWVKCPDGLQLLNA